SRGIKYLSKTKLARVDKDKVIFDNGSELKYDILITTPPHRSSQVVRDAGLTDDSGWIPVNPYNLATRHEDVFAIGDITSIETPHGHAPYLPKAGVFAQGQAEVVANNLAVSLTKKGEMKETRTWYRADSYLLYQMFRKFSIVFETRSSDVCPDVVGTFGDCADERSVLQCLQ